MLKKVAKNSKNFFVLELAVSLWYNSYDMGQVRMGEIIKRALP